jgi:predicted anti-sigma-YlaC factor YlaD
VDASSDCHDQRRRVSLQVDDELSEFESTLLRRHLASCASCRAFASGVVATRTMLTEASEQVPSRALGLPAVRSGKQIQLRRAVSIAAVAVAGAIGLTHLAGPRSHPSHSQTYHQAQPRTEAFGNEDLNEMRVLRRASLVASVERSWQPERNVLFG